MLVLSIIPHHPRWVILIEEIQDFTTIQLLRIGFEPSSKCGITACMCIDNILYRAASIGVECDSLLVTKMDLKADNIGNMLLHLKKIEVPQSLTATDVARIQILPNLILASAK